MNKERLLSLQGLRFVFIALIVVSHTVDGFDFGGECGVAFFFMLSGFVLSWAYTERVKEHSFRLKGFLLRQLSKFYPLHAAVWLAFVLLYAFEGEPVTWLQAVSQLLLVQCWFGSDAVAFTLNGPSWFLCCILFCYLLFPLADRLLMGMKGKAAAVAMLLLLGLYALLNSLVPDVKVNAIVYIHPVMRFFDFVWGIGLCRACRSAAVREVANKLRGSNTVAYLVVPTVFVLLAVAWWLYGLTPARVHSACLFWPFCAAIIFMAVVAERSGGRVAVLSSPLMCRLGDMTMEIYLVQYLVIAVCRPVFYHFLLFPSVPLVRCVIMWGLILLAAYGAKRMRVHIKTSRRAS